MMISTKPRRSHAFLHTTSSKWTSSRSVVSETSLGGNSFLSCKKMSTKTVRFATSATQLSPKPIRQPCDAPGRGRVTFAEKPLIKRIPSCKSMRPIDKEQCWYGSAERTATKQKARLCALKSIAECPKEVAGIEKGYKNCRYLAATMDYKEAERLLNEPRAVRKFSAEFVQWCCQERHECRGIEDWVSKHHSHNRSVVARKAREMVVLMSTQLGGKSADLIAAHYQELSRSATLLARFLGDADHKAAIKPSYESNRLLSSLT